MSDSRSPSRWVLVGLGLLAIAGATWTMVLRLNGAEPGTEPGLQAGLLDWIILTYVFSGLVAWHRRPDSRLGPLMIAGGLVTSLAGLSSATGTLPVTVGQAFDLAPFAIFLHVYLAFPSGRLEDTASRIVVALAYFAAVGMELIVLMLGGLTRTTRSPSSRSPSWRPTCSSGSSPSLAFVLLAGIGVLLARRRAEGRPTR